MTAPTDDAESQDQILATRWSLIERLRRWDEQESWREFFQIYWRLIRGVALRSGCTADEALEVVQETVISVAKEMKKETFRMNREFGSFKGWLLRITQRRIVDQLRKRPPPGRFVETHSLPGSDRSDSESIINAIADPVEEYWDREWEQSLLEAALQRVKTRVNPRHFQAFQLFVMKGFDAAQVAEALSTTRTQVYLYKHRVGALVKKELRILREGLL